MIAKSDSETKTAEDRKLSELGTHLDLLLDRTDPLQQTLWTIWIKFSRPTTNRPEWLWTSH